MDMMIDYTNLIEISAKRIRNTKETFVRSIERVKRFRKVIKNCV